MAQQVTQTYSDKTFSREMSKCQKYLGHAQPINHIINTKNDRSLNKGLPIPLSHPNHSPPHPLHLPVGSPPNAQPKQRLSEWRLAWRAQLELNLRLLELE